MFLFFIYKIVDILIIDTTKILTNYKSWVASGVAQIIQVMEFLYDDKLLTVDSWIWVIY